MSRGVRSKFAGWPRISKISINKYLTNNSTPKQLSVYIAVGILQYIIDVTLFIILFSLFGFPVLFNITSRAIAAVTGYYLNGIVTFKVGQTIGAKKRKLRFLMLWIGMTVLSSMAITMISYLSEKNGWPPKMISISKPLIEAALFLLSFLFQKLWVFNKT